MITQLTDLANIVKRQVEDADQLVIERENAEASDAVIWFHRGRQAGLQAVLHTLYDEFGVMPIPDA